MSPRSNNGTAEHGMSEANRKKHAMPNHCMHRQNAEDKNDKNLQRAGWLLSQWCHAVISFLMPPCQQSPDVSLLVSPSAVSRRYSDVVAIMPPYQQYFVLLGYFIMCILCSHRMYCVCCLLALCVVILTRV